jgi:CheY-like chemotaxis protein
MTDQRRRILIVDDYLDSLESWALYFTMCGFEVLTAGDGEAAVRIALESCPDIALLDLDLPIMTGVEAARQLRAAPETRLLPLIATTGYSGGTRFHDAESAGFDRILVKPCDPSKLLAEIEQLLAAKRAPGGSGDGQTPATPR